MKNNDLRNLEEFLSSFENNLKINILEDNKYLLDTFYISKEDFINDLKNRNFLINCFSTNEFYIIDIDNDLEYTLQVLNFSFDRYLVFKVF